MKRFKYVIIIVILIALIGGWYGYHEYNRKLEDLSDIKADVQISASDLIAAYTANDSAANKLYLDKKLAVKGKITSIEKDTAGLFSILLGTEVDISSVNCEMDKEHNKEAAALKVGDEVTMKGVCTGALTDVILNRCVIQK